MTQRLRRGRPQVEHDPQDVGPFAVALRAARTAKGLTQDRVAELSGLSERSVCYYESGREPLLHAALALSGALDFSLDALRPNGER